MAGGKRISRGSLKQTYVASSQQQQQQVQPSPEDKYPAMTGSESGGLAMKHIQLPPLSKESDLIFEVIMAFHVLVFTFLQFLHLYKTVWWLPQSFTNTGMNFYLMDSNLMLFITVMMGRRLPYVLIRKIMNVQDGKRVTLLRLLMILPLVVLLANTACSLLATKMEELESKSYSSYGVYGLYLFGPWIVHFYVHGFNLRSIFEPVEFQSIDKWGNHICSGISSQIRDEAQVLRKTFNVRLRRVILQATFMAYYSSFLPWAFVQQHVFYDIWFVIQHIILTWMLSFSLLLSRTFPPEVSDCFHKVACHLGRWSSLEPQHSQCTQWSPEHPPFLPGSVVKHQRDLYKAEGYVPINSEPGNSWHNRFQLVFSGAFFSRTVLCYHVSVNILGLLIFFQVTEWYQVISISSLLVTSLFTFVRLARDFLVVWKMYQAEELITLRGASVVMCDGGNS